MDFLGPLLDHLADFIPDWPWGSPSSGRRPRRPRWLDVPDVRGQTVDEASRSLSREGFTVAVTRLEERPAPTMGLVVDQIPAPGTRHRSSAPVRLTVLHPPARQP